MNTTATTPILERLSALGDETRTRILALLERSEMTVSELCSVLQIAQPNISRHLKTLTSEGWIEATIGAFETNAESLEAVKNASELVCDEFRLRHSQDQLEIDGSLLLKGIGRGD